MSTQDVRRKYKFDTGLGVEIEDPSQKVEEGKGQLHECIDEEEESLIGSDDDWRDGVEDGLLEYVSPLLQEKFREKFQNITKALKDLIDEKINTSEMTEVGVPEAYLEWLEEIVSNHI